jgi:EmrB/QacA subfamily drug resistance transporter
MASSTPPTAAPSQYPDHIDAAVLRVAGVVVLGAIMSILDITVVNVALPTFQRVFGHGGEELTYARVAWTVTGYTLALATVIPLTGWAADRFGTKRLYLTAVLLFTAGSALCATAGNINALIGFRVLQGLGGGMLMPLGMTIMTRAAGPHRMGRLMAILGVPMLLGPIMGPILGGWLIQVASWHWIFLINVPLGIIAIVYSWLVLDKDAPEPAESFDVVGMLMMSPGLALFLYGVSSLPSHGGNVGDPHVWLPALVGLVLMATFVWWSFRPRHPLLDLRLLANRNLAISLITMFLFAGAFFGGLLLVPTYFQQVRGESTLHAGLLVAPQGLGAMMTMPIAGRLSDRVPIGRIVPVGLALIIVGMFGLTQISDTTPYGAIIAMLVVMGWGMGGTMMPIMTTALRTLRAHEVARGSTLLNINQQIASSVGVATMSVVLTNNLKASPVIAGTEHLPGFPGGLTETTAAILKNTQPGLFARLGLDPAAVAHGMAHAGTAFAHTYWVAWAVIVVALIPALMLPRKQEQTPLPDDEDLPPVTVT